MIEDPCCVCGKESDVGCGINPHRYYCDSCWNLEKRGKINIRSGQAIQPVQVEVEDGDE